jgi:uncharacterized protein
VTSSVSIKTTDGFKLSAAVDSGDRPDCVVWLHGISVDKDEYLGLFKDGAEFLNASGYSSIRFDFRGHGKSSGSKLDFTVVGQALDTEAAVTYALQKLPITPHRIHLAATSFGAPPAIFAALRHPDVISTVALVAPVLSYRRTFLEPETDWAREIFNEESLERLYREGRLYFDDSFFVGQTLVEEMRLIRPDLALREVNQPVLIAHGDRDSMVPYDATVQACRGVRCVRLEPMAGIDHGHIAEGDDDGTSPASQENKKRLLALLLEHVQ